MIICFSGEGNTYDVSRRLCEALGGESVYCPDAAMLSRPSGAVIDIGDSRRVIWAFPIYSWGVPPVMVRLMRQIRIKSLRGEIEHYMVATCGDDAGMADKKWRTIMKAKGYKAMGAFTVIMPNTYVCMKGFDVDPLETSRVKLDQSRGRVLEIASKIKAGFAGADVVRGTWPRFKSAVIYPWFVRRCMSPKKFAHTDACVGCGLCSAKCPMDNIVMEGSEPHWGDDCAFCLRCYHVCPHHAVSYGSSTRGKGQYMRDKIRPDAK